SMLGGPVRDLNVMTRRGRARARVEVVRTGAEAARTVAAGDVVVHAIAGPIVVRVAGSATRAWTLAVGHTLVGTSVPAATTLELTGPPEGVAVVASVVPVPARA